MRYAEVAVDASVEHGRTFSYSIPPSLDVDVGQLVLVPFGSRTLYGVLFSLPVQPGVPETRDILSTPHAGPLLTDTQLRLARWISGYYMCSLFAAAAMMLPPEGRVRQKAYVAWDPNAPGERRSALTPYRAKVLEYVRGRGRVAEDRVIETMGQGARAALNRLVDEGLVVRTHGQARSAVRPRYREFAGLTALAERESPPAMTALARRAPRQTALLERLLNGGTPMVLAEARREYGRTAVNALIAKGWLQKETVALERDPLAGSSFPPASPVVLTPDQEGAAERVCTALAGPTTSPSVFLLEGVTGSGKTEVYLKAVERCLHLGKRAIVLVPEIALTSQIIERFASRFPGNVTVLHSGLTAGERLDQWWKVRHGECGVVIGSRSAVFAPQPDLGLIVVDEEHEWTYKQHDASPRYHSRDVALRLAQLSGSVVVLGSATPDVVSYHRALGDGFTLLRLPQRVVKNGSAPLVRADGSGLPSVQVVDMRRELREGNRLMFSRALLKAMGECLESGSQTILFLNRRGSASFMQCRKCGLGLRCRRCDIPLTYHRDAQRLICHYCGDQRVPPERCPRCLGYRMGYYGVGTQSVVSEVSRLFPGTKILRWDSDSASGPKAHQEFLERFRSGEAQVLVGTQMIAKGFHFPSVTLAGVVSADIGLNVPDIRAGERVFQLLCQVAGRAGRGPSEGRVVVQTYQPDNYAIRAAATQDYQLFYREEIARRRAQGTPPLGRLIRLLYTHTNRAMCEREALRLSDVVRRERDFWGYSDVEIRGPTPAYPARLKGHHRWQLILRGTKPRTLLDKVTVPQGWVVDVDPVGPG